jgi:preprotein translocase subunit SecD
MKTINLVTIAFLMVLSSCNSGVKPNAVKVTFGIYETVKISEIPDKVNDQLKTLNIQPERNTQLPVIGYILKADSSVLKIDLSKENFRLVKSLYPVDKDKKYYQVVAIKLDPVIDNSGIQNTKYKGNTVEIHFNLKGSRKWAALTKKNIGNSIAFIIDSQVYTMPRINGEITNGVALINGLENESFAKTISESLNAGIPH